MGETNRVITWTTVGEIYFVDVQYSGNGGQSWTDFDDGAGNEESAPGYIRGEISSNYPTAEFEVYWEEELRVMQFLLALVYICTAFHPKDILDFECFLL